MYNRNTVVELEGRDNLLCVCSLLLRGQTSTFSVWTALQLPPVSVDLM